MCALTEMLDWPPVFTRRYFMLPEKGRLAGFRRGSAETSAIDPMRGAAIFKTAAG